MDGKQVLMVEGRDDEHVVKHICGCRGLGRIEAIADYGGIDPLIEGIEVRLKESNIRAVGIIVDADVDIDARWRAISERLARSGFTSLPPIPPPDGLVLDPPGGTLLPRVGVWMMPDNKVPGILEDFLSFLVPAEDGLFSYVRNCIDKMDPALIRFSDVKKPKALIHSWLAYQEDPGRPLGLAISARYLDPALPAANTFASWLQRVFFNP
jgi:hypothetical protein